MIFTYQNFAGDMYEKIRDFIHDSNVTKAFKNYKSHEVHKFRNEECHTIYTTNMQHAPLISLPRSTNAKL